jgi:hypothetical protein
MGWLSNERDKLRHTMGDAIFRNGEYEHAAEKYGLCLTVDNDYSIESHLKVNKGMYVRNTHYQGLSPHLLYMLFLPTTI